MKKRVKPDKDRKKTVVCVTDRILRNADVLFVCNYTLSELNEYLRKRHKIQPLKAEEVDNYAAFSFMAKIGAGRELFFIWLPNFSWTLDSLNNMTHEVYHTHNNIWRYWKLSFSKTTEEFRAILFGYLCSDFAKGYRDAKSK